MPHRALNRCHIEKPQQQKELKKMSARENPWLKISIVYRVSCEMRDVELAFGKCQPVEKTSDMCDGGCLISHSCFESVRNRSHYNVLFVSGM